MSYILKQDAKAMLELMNKFPEHDAFLLNVDNSSGIGSTITLTIDVIVNDVAGKFTMEVTGSEAW